MKFLHRPDLFAWSAFNAPRNIDFNSVLWTRPGGNILIDPLPLSTHDKEHLLSLGGAEWIVLTTSDHIRDTAEIAELTGAQVAGPAAEKGSMDYPCQRWLHAGEQLVPGLLVLEMQGSKTPGELALLLEEATLVTGYLVRGQHAGRLNLLPAAKLSDVRAAHDSVRGLLEHRAIEAVIVGDGWSLFHQGHHHLTQLVNTLATEAP